MIPKEYLIDFDNLKVGDSVWLYGQVEDKIKSITHTTDFPILLYNNGSSYSQHGRFSRKDNYVSLFAKPFNFKEQERVILVKDVNSIWNKRVLINFEDNMAVCWNYETSIEDIKRGKTSKWKEWKELEEETIVKLTLQQVSNGEGVGVPAHLLRIEQ